MSDIYDILERFGSTFTPGDVNDPRVNPQLRQRIALEMMRKQRKAPQNIGEGLTAIGEAIGERRQEGRLAEQEIAAADRADELMKGQPTAAAEGGVVPPTTGAVSGVPLPPIVAADTATETPASPVITQPPTRSMGQPSPLPPDPTVMAAQPQPPAPPQLITPAGTNTIAPPLGALPPSARGAPMTDPRVREAVARTLAARGGRPPGPTEAGGQPPAQMPLATPTGGLSPAPRGLGGNPLDANAQMAALPPTTAGQGIRPAPPAGPPIRVEPREPTPPGRVGLTPTERWAAEVLQKDPYNERLKMRLAPILAQEQAIREHQQGILNKQYERQLKQADPQYQATLAESRQRFAKGEEPTLRKREDVEEGLYRDPTTGAYVAPRIEGSGDTAARPTFKPSTEFQGKTFANYGRTRLAHEDLTPELEKILVTSRGQAAMGALGLRTWQSEQYKEADTARENYVQALIRQLSGAGYGIQEAEAEARSMMPKYNDQPRVLAQKRAQRAQFIGGLESIIGPRGKKAAEWQMEQERAPALAKQKAINEQMTDVVPTHKGQEKVMRDARGNIVARRVWDGQNWREL